MLSDIQQTSHSKYFVAMTHEKTGVYDPVEAKTPVVLPNMRVGLLGGSFNPAHEGHLHISREALKRLELHQVWWLVTPGNPLKRTNAAYPTLSERMARASAIAASDPRIKITGFEAGLRAPYTIDAISYLKRRFPPVHFVWIMGGDNLAQLHRWRHWERLFKTVPILVMDRPAARHTALASPAAQRFAHRRVAEEEARKLTRHTPPLWAYVSIPLASQSSTAIRNAQRST
jgi:nicotinate-nucleotide adenylyltransferase